MSLQVIGAGFGRTGTHSLKLALEQLGFAPCHHMTEVFVHAGQAETWEAAARGEPVDWHAFLRDYRAAVDWPASYFWRELSQAFPEAKFILTERPAEDWYRSISSTIFEFMKRMPQMAPAADPIRRAQMTMASYIVGERTFGHRVDKEHVIETYRRHNEAVKRTISPDRLLVYETPEGWAPLCRFLGVPVPDMPFPKTNTTEEFRARIIT